MTIPQIIMSAVSIIAGAAFGLNGITANGLAKSNERIAGQGERITAVEVKIERLPVIEQKLDRLLEERGINPRMVEKNISLATSTKVR